MGLLRKRWPVRPAGKSEEGKAGEAVWLNIHHSPVLWSHSAFTSKPGGEQAVRVATGVAASLVLPKPPLSPGALLNSGRMLLKEERWTVGKKNVTAEHQGLIGSSSQNAIVCFIVFSSYSRFSRFF